MDEPCPRKAVTGAKAAHANAAFRATQPDAGDGPANPSFEHTPPLPDPFRFPEQPPSRMHIVPRDGAQPSPQSDPNVGVLRDGCYLLRFDPLPAEAADGALHYVGTLRVQREDAGDLLASGDLYVHQPNSGSNDPIDTEPNPKDGIPIFPRSRYRCYLRGSRMVSHPVQHKQFTFFFEVYSFDCTGKWRYEGDYSSLLTGIETPAEYPLGSVCFQGFVKNSSHEPVWRLTMGWISPTLRRATIEIDKVRDSDWPLRNEANEGWESIFRKIEWDVCVEKSDTEVEEPGDPSWSEAELHARMIETRDSDDLDREWRYHLLCVQKIDKYDLGIMYDTGGSDSNKIPREGAVVASHWVFDDDDYWGSAKGKRFGETVEYFRTALHEIGHAMGLCHPIDTSGQHLMVTADGVASSAWHARPRKMYPDNANWSFSRDDRRRLCHLPDMVVRPGGTPFSCGVGSGTPATGDKRSTLTEGLDLQVSPLLETVPLGAPVRVNLRLVNDCNHPMPRPRLSIKSECVWGRVIDPSGEKRSFMSLVHGAADLSARVKRSGPIPADQGNRPLSRLQPRESITDSLTLMRGAQGPLFPVHGVHRITVDVSWAEGDSQFRVRGETSVTITPPEDEDHEKAAGRILSNPDVLLTLAFGGDHVAEGIDAIEEGLENRVLRDHFTFIEAKRMGQRFLARKPDLKRIAELIDDKTVMSPAEMKRAVQLIQCAAKYGHCACVRKICETLWKRAGREIADTDLKKEIESLLKNIKA